jgi:hypothetical protein
MFVGMYMAFFLSHRRYWARLVPVLDAAGAATGRYEFIVAGAARRHQYAFDEEFVSLKEVLVAAFGDGESTKDRARALRDARRQQKSTESAPPTTKEST